MSHDMNTALPLPAPLPYSSAAARGEIPAPPSIPVGERPSEDPDAPLLREDEKSFWICVSIVAAFIVLMMAVAASGGL